MMPVCTLGFSISRSDSSTTVCAIATNSDRQNHGIPQATISAIHDAACQFFALPEDRKSQYSIANSKVSLTGTFCMDKLLTYRPEISRLHASVC